MEDYLIEGALRFARQGDLSHARRLLEMQVESYPEVGEGWYLLGILAAHTGDFKNGLSQLKRLRPWSAAARGGRQSWSTPASVSENRRITAHSTAQAVTMTSRALPPAPCAPKTNAKLGVIMDALHAMARWCVIAVSALLLLFVGSATFPMLMGGRTFVIVSGSMEPTIPKGAAAIAMPVSSIDLRVGDIIVYSSSPQATLPIVHRIVKIEERAGVRRYTTRGDANPTVDAAAFSLPATAWRVWYSVPLAGYLISFAAKPIGTLAAIDLPRFNLLALNLHQAVINSTDSPF